MMVGDGYFCFAWDLLAYVLVIVFISYMSCFLYWEMSSWCEVGLVSESGGFIHPKDATYVRPA